MWGRPWGAACWEDAEGIKHAASFPEAQRSGLTPSPASLTDNTRERLLPSPAGCCLEEAAQPERDQKGQGKWQYSDSCGEHGLERDGNRTGEKGGKTGF